MGNKSSSAKGARRGTQGKKAEATGAPPKGPLAKVAPAGGAQQQSQYPTATLPEDSPGWKYPANDIRHLYALNKQPLGRGSFGYVSLLAFLCCLALYVSNLSRLSCGLSSYLYFSFVQTFDSSLFYVPACLVFTLWESVDDHHHPVAVSRHLLPRWLVQLSGVIGLLVFVSLCLAT